MNSADSRTTASVPVPYQRVVLLDVLRGFALYGVFMVNAPFMAGPLVNVMSVPEGPSSEVAAWFVVRAFFLSKFVGIFSLLFGAGFGLQLDRAREAGRPFTGRYAWRTVLLGAMGLLHGMLLFEGDILFPYAVASFLMLALQRLGTRGLKTGFAICLLISMLSATVAGSMDESDWGASEESVAEAEESEDETAKSIRIHREGPLSELIVDRAGSYAGWLAISCFIGFNFRVLAAFFLGWLLVRTGFFSRTDARGNLRTAAWTLVLGLAGEIAAALTEIYGDTQIVSGLVSGMSELTSLLLSIGLMATIRCFVNRSKLHVLTAIESGLDRVAHWLACTGRMALTNYLSQSVFANLYFTFLGLAWYDTLSRVQVIALVSGTFAVQVAFSSVWMRFFRSGPLEWIWRSIVQLKVLPLRR